jgi:murein DD-endopeptidase MepM/ murein hydrolase activator NlpD
VDGEIVRLFAPPSSPYGPGHRGVDLAAVPGEQVRAVLAGVVTFAGRVAGHGWVTVDHGHIDTTYGRLEPLLVQQGDRVAAGDVIGLLAPGRDHLDWGARLDGAYIDPLALLGPWEARLVPPGRASPPPVARVHGGRGQLSGSARPVVWSAGMSAPLQRCILIAEGPARPGPTPAPSQRPLPGDITA